MEYALQCKGEKMIKDTDAGSTRYEKVEEDMIKMPTAKIGGKVLQFDVEKEKHESEKSRIEYECLVKDALRYRFLKSQHNGVELPVGRYFQKTDFKDAMFDNFVDMAMSLWTNGKT